MSKLNQNRLAFFGLGVVFGGWVLSTLGRVVRLGGGPR